MFFIYIFFNTKCYISSLYFVYLLCYEFGLFFNIMEVNISYSLYTCACIIVYVHLYTCYETSNLIII